MDTDGEIYFSLTQVSTNSDVYMVFLSKLAAKLTSQDPNWKEKTVLL